MKKQELLFFRKEFVNEIIEHVKDLYIDKTSYETEDAIKKTKESLIDLSMDVDDINRWLERNQYNVSADNYVRFLQINKIIKETIELQKNDIKDYDDMANEILASKSLTDFQKHNNGVKLHEQEHGSINRFIIQIILLLQEFVNVLKQENHDSGDTSDKTFDQIFPDRVFDISFTRHNSLKERSSEQNDDRF